MQNHHSAIGYKSYATAMLVRTYILDFLELHMTVASLPLEGDWS